MSRRTNNLDLLVYDPSIDGNFYFSVQEALTENFETIDEKVGPISDGFTNITSELNNI